MDKISDEQKLEWLTSTVAARERVILNKDHLRVPNYKMSPLRRQVNQPSFGMLGKLPSELLCMVFSHLTCDDLEALHSCSTGGCMAVLACPQYRDLLKHAPIILAILKETGLARSFTIKHIYETFVSPLCTNCGQFGGYVFLPSFTRCCRHCAETELKFFPISPHDVNSEFGFEVKSVLNSLPQLDGIPGCYSGFGGSTYFRNPRPLISRELASQFQNPKHVAANNIYSQPYVGKHSVKEHPRYMALTALPCFLPKSNSVEKGVYCAGCDTRAKEHRSCFGKDLNEIHRRLTPQAAGGKITDGSKIFCGLQSSHDGCILITEQDRLHDSRQVLSHLQGCGAAQALLKMKWTRSQEKISGMDS